MIKNGMPPVHPGEILREEYLIPLNMSATALAKHWAFPLHVLTLLSKKNVMLQPILLYDWQNILVVMHKLG